MRKRGYLINKKKRRILIILLFAEREGFEPPEARTSTVFKTAAIDHSAISPLLIFQDILNPKSECKDITIFEKKKY